MNATNCTRYAFSLGLRTLNYGALSRYVCNECGGGIVHLMKWNEDEQRSEDHVACARCGGGDIITESRYLEQIAEGWEVIDGLPESLKAQMKGQTKCLSAIEAIADLSD